MSLSPKAFDMPHATADDTNYAALPLEGRDAFTGSRVTFYENAVLTIDGVSSTVTDVSVSFSDDATEQCAPLDLSPTTFTTYSEWTPAFQAWHDRTMLEPMPLCYDEFTRHRDRPLWLRRGQRRAKAKAKRAKMRAARYAARWEQAHLRGEK